MKITLRSKDIETLSVFAGDIIHFIYNDSLHMNIPNNITEHAVPDPFLTAQETRVIGSLMEKQLTTPQYYPLTPNALTAACNQKSSREPNMNLSEGEVRHIANVLAGKDLVSVDSGDRTYKISHRIQQYFKLELNELAVLTVLLLRKPQTLNEILKRTTRMFVFEHAQEVHEVLTRLMQRETPLAILLPHGPSQREDRFWQTFCGAPVIDAVEKIDVKSNDRDRNRLDDLERRVVELENQLGELLQRLDD